MQEIWKDIEGYEGLYQVSNLGNVRSLNWAKRGIVKNLYLKKQNRGYLHVELAKNGVRKSATVHRLVAMAFIPNPGNLPLINHKDENPLNNRAENLEWCDCSYNSGYSLSRHPERAKNKKATEKYGKRLTLKINQYAKDGSFVRRWENSRTIFLETGYSDWSISECCRGKRKTAYGYIWRYAS